MSSWAGSKNLMSRSELAGLQARFPAGQGGKITLIPGGRPRVWGGRDVSKPKVDDNMVVCYCISFAILGHLVRPSLNAPVLSQSVLGNL